MRRQTGGPLLGRRARCPKSDRTRGWEARKGAGGRSWRAFYGASGTTGQENLNCHRCGTKKLRASRSQGSQGRACRTLQFCSAAFKSSRLEPLISRRAAVRQCVARRLDRLTHRVPHRWRSNFGHLRSDFHQASKAAQRCCLSRHVLTTVVRRSSPIRVISAKKGMRIIAKCFRVGGDTSDHGVPALSHLGPRPQVVRSQPDGSELFPSTVRVTRGFWGRWRKAIGPIF
jgi:hypothetical protein